MSDHFVRTQSSPTLLPPSSRLGVLQWMRENLFSSWANGLFTVAGLYLLTLAFPPIFNWAFLSAVFTGQDGSVCRADGVGACWAFIDAKFNQFVYGRYPAGEQWRVDVTALLGIAGLAPLLVPNRLPKQWFVGFLLLVFPFLAFVLLYGGTAGLVVVETSDWGGLMVTLVVAVTGIAASLPLGVFLALGRRSKMPVIRILSIMFIELWRGVPLITVLFMASVMLPLFLPEGMSFDKLLRALIGVALFSSAYMAEVVRGGLASVPVGQYEAAKALGLTYPQMMSRIVLPQALTTVIPGIVNNFIGLFKDTTLVLVIGLFDLLGIVQSNFTDPAWISPQTSTTGYVFAAFVFWIFCFSMSRYSIYMERRLETDTQR
ncbi:MAG: amino acid ABC transporter permease [Rhodobiaceae bacterium]|nr:MAG: amino acid ABC transporter permease [Rhodobiaceae bacterium]